MFLVHFKMKFVFKLVLIFTAYFGSNYSQSVTFIGSYFASPAADYKSVVLTDRLRSQRIEASLQGSRKVYFPSLTQNNFNDVNIVAPQEGNNGIKLEMKVDRCDSNSLKLINTADRSIVFINFDKPVYKTGEEFKFRIFVLDKNLKPYQNHKKIDIYIFDSEDYPIMLYEDITTTKFGVFEGSINIADTPNLGSWKIEAFVGDKKVSKTFSVYKPDENGLEVAVDAPAITAHVDRRLYITIHVKDNIDKFFVGTADIFVKAKFKNSNKNQIDRHVKTVDIYGSKKTIGIDFPEELGLKFLSADMILNFDIVVKDQATQRSIMVKKKTELKHKGRNTIQVVRNAYFKPTFRFNARVKVKVLDGRPDNSYNQLNVGIKYIAKNTKIVEERNQINLKMGETLLNLQPKTDTVKILLNLKFDEIEHFEEIDRFPGYEEYMQVNPTSKISISSDKAMFVAKASEDMELLHVVVVGTHGIIYSQEFSDSIGKDIVNFEIPLSEEMKPEARGLAFYIRNGAMIYDEFSIKFAFSIDNALNITSPESAKPNKIINYEVKTERGSQVFITAVDQNPNTLKRDNEISRTDIYNELVSYINLKFPKVSKYHFEKFNGLVFEPFVDGRCNNIVLSSEGIDSKDDDDLNLNSISKKYFPEIMINNQYVAKSSNSEKITAKIPESLTTWRFYGISVHPERGFTVAKLEPKINVKKDLVVQIRAPVSAYDTEAFTVETRVYNSLNERVEVRGTIQIENGFIPEKKESTEFGLKCEKLSFTGPKQKQLSMTLSPEEISKPTSFLVQPNRNKNVVIKVSVTGGNNEDEVEKVIEIRKPGSYQGAPVNKKIYGSLLDSGLNGLENMSDQPLLTNEEKMLKFAMAITNYKFFEALSKTDEELAKKALKDIVSGYQEAIVILENILPELNPRQQMDPKFTWLVSMTAQNLMDAQKFTFIDKDLITKSLDFIKSQQDRGGKFKYDENSDYHRNIGDGFRTEIQTALIIAAFLKDESTKVSYNDQIYKTLNFLKTKGKSWNNYPKIIAAYTLALNGDTEVAKNLLSVVNSDSYANANSEFNSVSIEIASYMILTKLLLREDPQDEIKWLLSQRNSDGSFHSPYDTVLVHQALFEYTIFKNGRVQGLKSTNNARKEDIDGFGIAISEEFGQNNEAKINLKIVYNGTDFDKSNLVVVDVELPRGYIYNDYKNQYDNLEKIAVQNNRGRVIFYINKLEKNKPFKLTMNVLKIFDFENHEQSTIKVYDYYSSNIRSISSYDLDKNADNCKKTEIGKDLSKEKSNVEKIREKVNKIIERITGFKTALTEAKNSVKTINESIDATQKDVDDAEELATSIHDVGLIMLNTIDEALNATKIQESKEDSVEDGSEEPTGDESKTSITEETPWKPRENYISVHDAIKDKDEAEKSVKAAQDELDSIIDNVRKLEEKFEKAKTNANNAIKTAENDLRIAEQNIDKPIIEAKSLKNISQSSLSSVKGIENSIKSFKNDISYCQNVINNHHEGIDKELENVNTLISGVKGTQTNVQLLITDIIYEQNQGMRQWKAFELKGRLIGFQSTIQTLQTDFENKNGRAITISSSTTILLGNFKENNKRTIELREKSKEFIKEVREENKKILKDQNKLQSVKDDILSSQNALQEAQKKLKNAKRAKLDAEKYEKLLENERKSQKEAETKHDAALKILNQLNNIIKNLTTEKPVQETSIEKVKQPDDLSSQDTSQEENTQKTSSTSGTESMTHNDKFNTTTVRTKITAITPTTTTPETTTKSFVMEGSSQTTAEESASTNSNELDAIGTANYNSPEMCNKWYRFCGFGL